VPARVVLAIAALLVLGSGVYLLLQVRSGPAEAGASATRPVVVEPVQAPEPEPATQVTATAQPTSGRRAAVRLGDLARAAPAEVEPVTATGDRDDKPYQLDQLMDEANRAYDRMEFDEARAIAQRILAKQPTNVRMLRIMVSAACIEVEPAEAQKYFNQLPARDREQMKTRCMKHGVTFTDPPPGT
jgi:hypothetical protein